MIGYFLLGTGWLATAILAQIYRNQRDDLAHAWLHFHPEDFPDLNETDA